MILELHNAMNEEHIGSDFDAFLQSEGLLKDAEAVAAKRVVAFQIAQPHENPAQHDVAFTALLASRIAEAPTSPEAIEEAEADLLCPDVS